MIIALEPLAAGNAVRVLLSPPDGAASWRVLRRPVNDFTGPDDNRAAIVDDASQAIEILDAAGLQNGTLYWYAVFYQDAAGAWAWKAEPRSVTPAATYRGNDVDPLVLLRDRLGLGLAVEVQRKALQPASGAVQVLTAPFALATSTNFPCVSVHLDSTSNAVRALGDHIGADQHFAGIGWDQSSGWLSKVSLNIVGVSLNGDERIALRRAIERIVLANLPIFDGAGLENIEFSQHDTEQPGGANNAVLYITAASFSCLVPRYVTARVGEISDVTVDATEKGFPYG